MESVHEKNFQNPRLMIRLDSTLKNEDKELMAKVSLLFRPWGYNTKQE